MSKLSYALSIWLATLSATGYAQILAERHEQSINPRAQYLGGYAWAAGGSSCPSNFPVKCTSVENLSCCPNGQTCQAAAGPYCCPTTADCYTQVKTLPSCADQTMNMYSMSGSYFCCTNDTIGVLPSTGWGGLCLQPDQPVPASLLATVVSQIGGTAIGGGISTSVVSATGAARTSARTTGAPGASASAASSVSQSSPGATSGSSGAASTASSSGTTISTGSHSITLSTGAIVGIAVGGFAVLCILAFIGWCCCCRRRRRNRQEVYVAPTSQYQPAMPQYSSPAPPYNQGSAYPPPRSPSPMVSPSSQYKQPVGVNEQQYPARSPQPYEVDGRTGRLNEADGVHRERFEMG